MDILKLIGRDHGLFSDDINANEKTLSETVRSSRFLVIGGAGSIGQAVVKEIFCRNPRKLHVVDISENNMVELVRDIRSSYGYIDGEFSTFAIDAGSTIFDAFMRHDGKYDYVLNLSALKHVRSEKDPFTLMRMIETNILNTDKTIIRSAENGARKYFCVSTDKAANPVNMMGATKRIMEMYLMRRANLINISSARFANVAFSDGSLLYGFDRRIEKNQPIVAPNDVRRYFVTPQESGQLCLMSCLLGGGGDIFFPQLSEELDMLTFSEIAVKYLEARGYEPYLCRSEDEAREMATSLIPAGKWPCLFEKSDTTGEKAYEEFYTEDEITDMTSYKGIGVIKNRLQYSEELMDSFTSRINTLRERMSWEKKDLLELINVMIPGFCHMETGKYLDSKM